MNGKQLIDTLWRDYESISSQVAYHLEKKNTSQYAMYVTRQRVAAIKIITALIAYFGVTEDELNSEMRDNV